MQKPIHVLLVNNTEIYRTMLTGILGDIPDVLLSASAPNGKVALSILALYPIELILLDIEILLEEGMFTLRTFREKYPAAEVILMGSSTTPGTDIIIKALEAGALDYIPRSESGDLLTIKTDLHQRLIPVFKDYHARHPVMENRERTNPRERKTQRSFHVDVIVIAVSTGGPTALNEVIPKLPADIGVPILVVQHMPAMFTTSFAKSLDSRSQLTVKEAEDREPLQENTVYIAPGGRHMAVCKETRKPSSRLCVEIHDEPPENSCRPSADVLFRSVAEHYGKNVLVIIMTGMGSDGALGVQEIKKAGGYCLTQSETSCVVYGMPRAVDDLGLSDESIDLTHLATRMVSLVQRKIRK